jgi:hypothetical protein
MNLVSFRPDQPPLRVEDYYDDAAVRARILECCGGTPTRPPSAAFVVGFEPDHPPFPTWDDAAHRPPDQLPALFARGADISRSLWDTDHLIFLLELDYQNIDHAAEPFVHPADVFLKLEPAYHAVTSVFGMLRLRARPLVTGRGYHFLGKIPLGDPLVDALAELTSAVPPWYATHTARRPAHIAARISARQARAAEGLGRLLEYAAHLILGRSSACPIPVVFNGTVVGPGANGRECVSIDFSHAGDPLDVRHVRVGFSAYQWHRYRPDIFGAEVASRVPPLVVIPRGRHSLMTLLEAGRDLAAGRDAAHASTAVIPNVVTGVRALLSAYLPSPLAAFHRHFDQDCQSAIGTVARDVPALPPCVASALARPNDLLLKPEHLQHLVRDLVSRGWNAAQIAGLVEARYEEDHDWGDRWQRMDARTRAQFDVRVFAGLIVTDADTLADFNCVSAQQKGLCPRTGCQYDLRRDRDRLLSGSHP